MSVRILNGVVTSQNIIYLKARRKNSFEMELEALYI